MTRPQSNAWTDEQLAMLRANYGKIPLTELCKQIGRSYYGTASKARDLGLYSSLPGKKYFSPGHSEPARNAWPIEDDQFIIANRLTMSNQALGHALGKSASAVKNRCWRLKIPTSPIGTVYSHPKRPGSAVDKFKLTMLAQAAKTAAATAARCQDGWPPRARDPEKAMERALAGRRYNQAATW